MTSRVLVVEAAGSIRAMIEALLGARGYEVRSEATGSRGIEEAHAWRPEVVLVDAALPGATSGIEVCTKLRERGIPVVVLGGNDDELKLRAREAGANAVYDAPFSPLALLEEIEKLTKR